LNRIVPRSLAPALVPIALLLCGFSCGVPLAPGYRIVRESTEIRFVSGQTPELQIRARYAIQNSGNSDLRFVDVSFPEQKAFGRKNLRVEVDGRETTLGSVSAENQEAEPDALRIAFDPPWTRKQTREFSIEYAFSSPEGTGARITLTDNAFHLGARGWLPEFLPPKHLLAPNPMRPPLTSYTVRVPADFFIAARGSRKGQKKVGDETEYRFQLTRDDLAPFVVAGRYVTWPPDRNAHSPIFWTTAPLKGDASPAAERIMAAWGALVTAFGPLDKHITVPQIVESPGLRGRDAGGIGPAAVAFPGGAIVNPAALALGPSSDQFFEIVVHALAHDWFGEELYAAPNAAVGMGEGLPEYATIVVDEAQGGSAARNRRVVEYLQRYDEARKEASEVPVAALMMTDPIGPRRIAFAKAPLFYVALEDACGEAPVRAGLAHLAALQRGQAASYPELRSALEQSTNRDLAKLFRLWLNEKGIPDDFRSRYQGLAAGEVAEK
jgi:hypothetical protein